MTLSEHVTAYTSSASAFVSSAYQEYIPSASTLRSSLPKFRPEVACAVLGFIIGMSASLGLWETVDTGVFMLSQAASATAWTANWFVEPKYTGQEDLPPGFRGESPSLDARHKDDSQPTQCQTVDPSALVCSTVRVSGFSMWGISEPEGFVSVAEPEGLVFTRRAFDEIQGRAPFVSENDMFLAFWCEQAAAWRITNMADEQIARDGSCQALAASDGGVQFKDAAGWMESKSGQRSFPSKWPRMGDTGVTKVEHRFEISVGDPSDEDSWVHSSDVTCR